MATIEQLNEGILRADAAGDSAAVKILGAELLRLRRAQGVSETLQERGLGDAPFPPGPGGENVLPRRQPGAGEFLNRGIASALGAPVDIVNIGLGAVGLGSERPIGGSEQIADVIRNVTPVAGRFEQPETVGQAAAEGVGLAGGSLLGGGAAVAGLTRAGGVAGRAAKTVAEPFLTGPGRATALEMGAGAGAGAGGRLAEDAARHRGQNAQAARLVGELVGGAAVVIAPGAAVRAAVGNGAGHAGGGEKTARHQPCRQPCGKHGPDCSPAVHKGRRLHQGIEAAARSQRRSGRGRGGDNRRYGFRADPGG